MAIKMLSFIFLFVFLMVSSISPIYADATSPVQNEYDLTSELDSTKETELKNFDTLAKMMTDIFSFEYEYGHESLNDTSKLLYELIEDAIVRWDKFTGIERDVSTGVISGSTDSSTIYRYIQGIALLFLMIAFMVKIYEDNQVNFEDEMFSKEMIRSMVYFIFALIILLMLKYYVSFLLAFFRFLVDKIIALKSNNDLGVVESLIDTIKPKTVAYYILSDSDLVGSGSLIEEVAIRSKEASLRSMYMFPWIVTWICKVGELIVVFLNSTLFIIYGTFFPIALYDAISDLKTSNFLVYGKNITAIAVEEVVIIAVIYISNLILNPFINRILNNIAGGSSNLSFVSMAIIVTAVQATKLILLGLSFPLSRKLLGVH